MFPSTTRRHASWSASWSFLSFLWFLSFVWCVDMGVDMGLGKAWVKA